MTYDYIIHFTSNIGRTDHSGCIHHGVGWSRLGSGARRFASVWIDHMGHRSIDQTKKMSSNKGSSFFSFARITRCIMRDSMVDGDR